MESVEQLAERFAACPAEIRDWAEKAGYENLKARLDSAGMLSSQASTTLTVILAGLGGSLAYAVKIVEPSPGPIVFGAATLCVYLALAAALLVAKCMTVRDVPMLYNQPSHLLIRGAQLEQLKVGELANLEIRIRQMNALNAERAKWLNRARGLAIASPLVFVAAAVVARYL